MIFKTLLKDLVTSVDGASGAVILDWEGEMVEWWTSGDKDRMMLRCAYMFVAFKSAKSITASASAGQARQLVIEYSGGRFVVEEIAAGYAIVIELSLSGNIGEALRQLEPAVAEMRREIE